MYVGIYVCIYVFMYVCMYVCMYICMYVRTYIRIHIYVSSLIYLIFRSVFSDYGTVLFISSLEHTPDGRSLITTMGERRFQVLERTSIDGYAVAKIQFIADQLVEGEEQISESMNINYTMNINDLFVLVSLRSLQESVFQHSMSWLNALPFFSRVSYIPWSFFFLHIPLCLVITSCTLVCRHPLSCQPLILPCCLPQLLIMQNSCSPPPPIEPVPENCPDGPAWVWWFLSCVPISSQRKMRFLCCTSLRERLIMLRESLPVPEPNIT